MPAVQREPQVHRPRVLDTPALNLVNVGLLFSLPGIALVKGHLPAMDIRSLIRKIPDYPGSGDTCYGLNTLLEHGPGFHAVIDLLAARYTSREAARAAGAGGDAGGA